MMLKKNILFATSIVIILTSCKKYLDVGSPSTQLISSTVFKSDATAIAAQLAIYEQMESDGLEYNMLVNTGLSSDELTNYVSGTNYVELTTNNLTSSNTSVQSMWSALYKYIYEANAVLDGVQNSSSVSNATKNELAGEAKFTRAFCHFYLVNLFGKIPLALSTDYRTNAELSRQEIDTVYAQIVSDLNDAANLLPDKFIGANGSTSQERVRPTKWAAEALLARVYLYKADWNNAISKATDVINATSLFSLLPDLNQVFLKNSKEAVWQLQSVIPTFNSFAGAILVTSYAPSTVALSPSLLSSFEPGDKRYTSWVKAVTAGGNVYYYPYKYKVGQGVTSVTEYTMVLRLAELFLIRAEAYAMVNNLAASAADINVLRTRASLPLVNASTQADLLAAINRERNAELFVEFGDRWLNLKRTGTATAVLQPVKGPNWTPGVDELYPIPQTEIIRDSRLTQNPGY